MAKLTYRCTNYNECDKANDREIISLEQGEETICPECKRPLKPEPSGGNPPGPRRKFLLATVGGAIVLAASAAGFLIFKPAPPPVVTVESCLQEVWPWLK